MTIGEEGFDPPTYAPKELNNPCRAPDFQILITFFA